MATLAVISEYHPYHNGHAFLLSEGKRLTGAEHAISVMSGHFTQQGTPMYWDKLTRAGAAAAAGIDLVFELPFLFAAGAAGDFARGAVKLLDQLGNVDYLCFGAEDPDPEAFDQLTDILLTEPPLFKNTLKDALSAGKSFPEAREDALSAVLGEGIRPLLRKPNNILALEYLLALKLLHSPIRPVPVKRTGDYHGKRDYSSATAIRRALKETISGNAGANAENKANHAITVMKDHLPPESLQQFALSPGPLTDTESSLTMFLSAVMLSAENELSEEDLPLDMTPALYRRLLALPRPFSWEDAIERLHTRDITKGRVGRVLLHMLLGVTNRDRTLIRNSNDPLYLNLLALRKESSFLLRQMGEVSRIPIITKRSRYQPERGSAAARLWEIDCKATEFYNQLLFAHLGIRREDELRSTPVVV
ncbi:MAG: nucleotidyltransferase family protein [Eubacterium sp.]|nr:nucleotidyltransferase family protein [Eubacterium sp.]